MSISEPVRELAVYPFRVLPKPPDVERIELDRVWVSFNPWPTAQLVVVHGDGPADVASVVEQAREAARARGKKTQAWWIPPENDDLAPALEACGLVNEDTPGFEAIENAMALVSEPEGPVAPELDIHIAETYEDWHAGSRVTKEAFGMPEVPEDELRDRYADYQGNANWGRSFVAFLDGRAVGTSFAAFGDA